MSNESMQKVYDAAKLFVTDTDHLDGLRAALTAHDGEEKPKPKRASRAKTPAADAAKGDA